MQITTPLIIALILLATGCTPQDTDQPPQPPQPAPANTSPIAKSAPPDKQPDRPLIDARAMKGRPLAEVIATYQLDKHERRDYVNPPPDGPLRTVYFLEHGNLELWHMGHSSIVKNAIYLPSDDSAAERSNAWDAAFSKWIEQRTGDTKKTNRGRPEFPNPNPNLSPPR